MQVSNFTGELCRAQITLGSDYKVEILLDTAVSYRGAALHTWRVCLASAEADSPS